MSESHWNIFTARCSHSCLSQKATRFYKSQVLTPAGATVHTLLVHLWFWLYVLLISNDMTTFYHIYKSSHIQAYLTLAQLSLFILKLEIVSWLQMPGKTWGAQMMICLIIRAGNMHYILQTLVEYDIKHKLSRMD